ncbi:MAG: hypothetical protein WD250_13660 [Egibacteraceae bacterium]
MTAITLGPVTQTARTHASRSGQMFAAVVLAAMLLGLSAGTAVAQDYPPSTITVGTPNATITISGIGWGAGTTVTIVYEDTSGATATAAGLVESDGTFAAQLAIPEDAELGHAAATVTGTGADGQPREESERVFVQEELPGAAGDTQEVALGSPSGGSTAGSPAPGAVVPAGDLPTTGGVNLGITAVALALLAAGGAALTVARRRQGSAS